MWSGAVGLIGVGVSRMRLSLGEGVSTWMQLMCLGVLHFMVTIFLCCLSGRVPVM